MQDRSKEFTVKEIQRELLELLKIFHGICTENEISYSLYAGSLIGAVREKGFIPWDDDVDVSFTRAEYEKFKKVISTGDFGENIVFDEFSNSFPQLWMHRDGKPVVWLDFFIYDFISEKRFVQKLKIAGIAFYIGILKNKRTMELTKRRGLYKGPKLAFVYLLYFIGKLFPDEAKHRSAERFNQRFAGKKTLIHRANDRFIGVDQVHPKSVMEKYMLVPFEDTELMITEDYHRILVVSYDEDYMTPKQTEGDEADIHNVTRMII